MTMKLIDDSVPASLFQEAMQTIHLIASAKDPGAGQRIASRYLADRLTPTGVRLVLGTGDAGGSA